ncbi:hypothetical protein [Caulobacter sp. 602-1]|nr:hypothetical protein [Caulobacter sp. 602-1]
MRRLRRMTRERATI